MFISKNMDNQNLSDNPFNNLIAFLLTGGQDISKRCPQRFLGSSVTNRYIPFSQKANERIRDLGELIRNLYQQWGVICIELFRSNTPKSLCCKEFSQLVPLSGGCPNHPKNQNVTSILSGLPTGES